MKIIEWLAVLMGLCGSALWSANTKYSKWAGVLWFLDSLLWIFFAGYYNHPGLLFNNIIMVLIYGIGISRWLYPKKVKPPIS